MPKRDGFYISGVGLAPHAGPLPPGLDLRGEAMARIQVGLAADPLLARLALRHERLHDGRPRSKPEILRILAVLSDPAFEAPPQPMAGSGR